MTPAKRLFDICLALVVGAIMLVPALVIAMLIARRDGFPVLYRSERMKTVDEGFTLLKFRTMSLSASDSGVSGGDKSARVTPIGAMLRRYRLDEIPQLLNILKGDMSFVGPRPPLRQYTDRFPDLYRTVLMARPGLTGLATLRYRRTEERLLAACTTTQETDRVYAGRCVPRKAALDRIYARNQSVCFDIRLLVDTLLEVLGKQTQS